jgi:hypothetical protein
VLLRAVAKEARPARRRLVVGIAFAVFLGGLLTAARLAIVVLGTSLVIVVLVGSTSAVRALRRNRHQLRRYVRLIVSTDTPSKSSATQTISTLWR